MPDSIGFSRSVFATRTRHAATKSSGIHGYAGTRKGRGASGRRRRSTTTASPVAAWNRNTAKITYVYSCS
jgi:hypothetical protein